MATDCPFRSFIKSCKSYESSNVTNLAGGKYLINPERIFSYYYALSIHQKDYWIQEIANPNYCKLFFDIDNREIDNNLSSGGVKEEKDWITDEIITHITQALGEIVNKLYSLEPKISFVFNDKYKKQKCHIYVTNVITKKEERVFITKELALRVPELAGRIDNANGLRVIGAYKPFDRERDEDGNPIGAIFSNKSKGRYIPEEGLTLDAYKKYSLLDYEADRRGNVLTPLNPEYEQVIYGSKVDNYEYNKFKPKDEEKAQVVSLIMEHPYIKDKFSIENEFADNGINLIRKRRDFCDICERVHDNDGCFVFYNEFSFTIYCRRQQDKRKNIYVKFKKSLEEKQFNIKEHLTGPDNSSESSLRVGSAELSHNKLNLRLNNKVKIPSDTKWVLPFSEEFCRVIKAPLGKGKSTQCIKWINSLPEDEKILVLTPRQSYAKSITNELNRYVKADGTAGRNFVCYLDTRLLKKRQSVVIQVESLHRINTDFHHIILDECESILTQLTSINTQEKHYRKNHYNFLNLFGKYSVNSTLKSVTFMDAFISNKTINFINDLGIPYNYYDYCSIITQVPRKFIQYKYVSKSEDQFPDFINQLVGDLSNGKRIYMFCSSFNKLKSIEEYLKGKFPQKIIKCYHKENTIKGNVKELWIDADIIITTSTITVGCNFDIPDIFHKLYIFANACSKNLVRDIFQSSMRVRHLIDNQLVLYTDWRHNGSCLPTIRKSVTDSIEFKDKCIKNSFREFYKETEQIYKNLYIENTLEQNQSIMHINEVMELYLKECNYSAFSESSEEEENGEEEEIVLPKDSVQTKIEYKDIPEISDKEYKKLLNLKIKTSKEEHMICKYKFRQLFNIKKNSKILATLWKLYIDPKYTYKFYNLQYEKKLRLGIWDLKSIMENSRGDIFDKEFVPKLQAIFDICVRLGLKHSQDIDKVVERELIKNIDEKTIAELTKLFKFRDYRGDKSECTFDHKCEVIKYILKKWGFSNIKPHSNRKREDDIETTPFIITGENYYEKYIQT